MKESSGSTAEEKRPMISVCALCPKSFLLAEALSRAPDREGNREGEKIKESKNEEIGGAGGREVGEMRRGYTVKVVLCRRGKGEPSKRSTSTIARTSSILDSLRRLSFLALVSQLYTYTRTGPFRDSVHRFHSLAINLLCKDEFY